MEVLSRLLVTFYILLSHSAAYSSPLEALIIGEERQASDGFSASFLELSKSLTHKLSPQTKLQTLHKKRTCCRCALAVHLYAHKPIT